ncbi:MAG: chemotaxis protein CheW [Myxococcota bacterium]
MSDTTSDHHPNLPVHLAASAEESETSQGQRQEFLGLGLAEASYALPLSSIREIVKHTPTTAVPRAPSHILGIISVRGRITTVIDLRKRLKLPAPAATHSTRILLVDNGHGEVLGLLVDRVLSVYRLHEEEIEYSAAVSGELADYVTGIGRPSTTRGYSDRRNAQSNLDEEELLILLDPTPLLKR